MRIYNFLKNRWWLIYGTGLAIGLFYVLMVRFEPDPEANTIIYTQVILRGMGIIAALPPVILLVMGEILFSSKRQNFNNIGYAMIVLPLILISFALFQNQPTIGDQRLWHTERIRVGGHIYNHAEYHLGHLVVYECDGLGIVCHTIYRGVDLATLEYREECFVPPRFVVDQQTVSLIIQCETVFSHPLPP